MRLSAREPAAQAVARTKACPRCASVSGVEMRFCTTCGHSFDAPASPGVADGGGAVRSVPPGVPDMLPAREPAKRGGAARLVAVMKDGSDGKAVPLEGARIDVGRTEGDVVLGDDPYLSDRHARIERRNDQYFIRDLDSWNGIYARIREAVELRHGELVLIGQQVLRFEMLTDTETPLGPASFGGVLVFGTPEVPRLARFAQYTTEGVTRDIHYLYREETVLGRENGDIVFTDDPFLSRKHASVTIDRATKRSVLRDLGSSNGTAVRFRGERALRHGDQIRMGRHLFRFDQPGAA